MVMPLGNEDPPRTTPWVTYGLILLNVIGFALELAQPLSFTIAYAATPYEISNGVDIHQPFTYHVEPSVAAGPEAPEVRGSVLIHQAAGPRPIWLTLITALFLHADSIHLAGNMLFLFIFGQKVEEAMGRLGYFAFYLACGVAGTTTQILTMPNSLTPTLGASAAIAGVMGADLIWFPRDRVRVLVVNTVLLIPAYAVIGCWLAIQLLKGYLLPGVVTQTSHVAYLAHLGGASAGIVISASVWLGTTWWSRPDRR